MNSLRNGEAKVMLCDSPSPPPPHEVNEINTIKLKSQYKPRRCIGGLEAWLHTFLTSTLDAGAFSTLCPGRCSLSMRLDVSQNQSGNFEKKKGKIAGSDMVKPAGFVTHFILRHKIRYVIRFMKFTLLKIQFVSVRL